MIEAEARREVKYNTEKRAAQWCPTTNRECNGRCICYTPSKALPPQEHIRETWEVSPTICTHKNHPMPERPYEEMSCTFTPHKVVKEDK